MSASLVGSEMCIRDRPSGALCECCGPACMEAGTVEWRGCRGQQSCCCRDSGTGGRRGEESPRPAR
eukprot:8072710-Alexandrium_andersonii.AAC.1